MRNGKCANKMPDWPALNAACRCARIHPGWSPPEPEPPGRNCCRPPPPAQLTRRGHQVNCWNRCQMSPVWTMMVVGRQARWMRQTWGWPDGSLPAVLRIHDSVVWIRIRGSMPLTNGSGFGSGSCYFRHWLSRRQQKTNLEKFLCLLLFEGTFK